jgi:hypothetical protein
MSRRSGGFVEFYFDFVYSQKFLRLVYFTVKYTDVF